MKEPMITPTGSPVDLFICIKWLLKSLWIWSFDFSCVCVCVCVCVWSQFSYVSLFVTLWTVARQAPLSMGFSRQEYWSGLPWPPPGDLPDPGIQPTSSVSGTGSWVLYH